MQHHSHSGSLVARHGTLVAPLFSALLAFSVGFLVFGAALITSSIGTKVPLM